MLPKENLLRKIVRVIDLYITPAIAAENALDRLDAHRIRVAASNDRWRKLRNDEINSDFVADKVDLPKNGTAGYNERKNNPFYKTADGIFASLTEQHKIEHLLVPDPWWVPLAKISTGISASRLQYLLEEVQSKFRRGWAPSNALNFDTSLCKIASEMLEYLAENGSSYPGESSEWQSRDEWVNELRYRSAALREYENSSASDETYKRWHDLACNTDSESADRQLAWITLSDEEKVAADFAEESARESLIWIAYNLKHLWS